MGPRPGAGGCQSQSGSSLQGVRGRGGVVALSRDGAEGSVTKWLGFDNWVFQPALDQ